MDEMHFKQGEKGYIPFCIEQESYHDDRDPSSRITMSIMDNVDLSQ
jgi:hypothetical protein